MQGCCSYNFILVVNDVNRKTPGGRQFITHTDKLKIAADANVCSMAVLQMFHCSHCSHQAIITTYAWGSSDEMGRARAAVGRGPN